MTEIRVIATRSLEVHGMHYGILEYMSDGRVCIVPADDMYGYGWYVGSEAEALAAVKADTNCDPVLGRKNFLR